MATPDSIGIAISMVGIVISLGGLILLIAGRLGRWTGRKKGLIVLVVGLAIFIAGPLISIAGTATVTQTTILRCGKCGDEISRSTKAMSIARSAVPAFQATVEDFSQLCGGEHEATTISKCKDCGEEIDRETTTLSLCKTELATFEPEAVDRTSRCLACEALAQYNSEKTHLTLAQVQKNPDAYILRVVRWTGRAFNVRESDEGTAFQVMDDNYNVFVVTFDGRISNLVDDMRVRVLGYVTGTFSGTNAFGATVTFPKVLMVKIWHLN